MMHVRPIRPDELGVFAAVPGQDERNAAVRQYIEQMIDSGAMRSDWCFVAEDAGQVVGSIGYWTLPASGIPLDFVLLELPWEDDYLFSGRTLLHDTFPIMQELGAQTIEYVLDTPPMWPQWQTHAEQRVTLLESVGFSLTRETLRFESRDSHPAGSGLQRLSYRSLEEVGDDAFIAALVQVSAGSLDRRTQQERDLHGAEQEASESFEMLRQMEHEPGWWELAYTPGGDLVGLIMPAKNPTFATIGYIGVVPAQRGRGYVDDLLARGSATLRAAGFMLIRADTDVYNTPMARAFRRAGYVQFATRREYGIDLTSAMPER
jgi:RimJ/RimL family protein N-acetyltransferase